MAKYLKQGFVRELEWKLGRVDGRRMHQELQSRNL